MAKKSQYADMSGMSGITRFEIHPNAITVHFGKRVYKYTHETAGADHVGVMKRLAASGVGLATYIRTNLPGHEK